MLASADPRYVRLGWTVATSLAAKAVRIVAQVAIAGLAIRHLGPAQYGLWMTIVAALAWLSWGQAGLAPGLVNALVEAEVEGRPHVGAVYLSTALAIVSAVGLMLAAVAIAVVESSGWLRTWFADFNSAGDGTAPGGVPNLVLVCVGLAALRLPLGLIESLYTALQRLHVLRTWEIAGQVLAVVAAAAVLHTGGSVAAYVAVTALAAESCVIGAGWYALAVLRPQWRLRWRHIDLAASTTMLRLSGGFLAVQIAGYLVIHAGVVILAARHGPEAIVPFALTWQLYQSASGIWAIGVSGLWGALAEARVKRDWVWIRQARRRLVLVSMLISVAFSALLALAGRELIAAWSGGRVEIDGASLLAMAIYCSLFTWAVVHAQVLSALSMVWPQIWAALANGVLVVLLSALLVPVGGIHGLAVALLLATMLTTAWWYPLLFWRRTA